MDGVDDPSKEFLNSTRFWIQKVFVPILVCIGVGGNTLTVMVLTRKRMRCSTNIYLTALAIADIIYLLFVLTLSFKVYNNIDDRKYELYWRFLGLTHWLVDAASSASVWLTVSFTLERYIVVCHPIKGKVLCTENRAKSIIVIVAIFCILTTASTTFEYELALNETCIRNCTNDELKKMHQSSGNSLRNTSTTTTTTIHYLPNHSIVVTKLDNSENNHQITNAKLLKEIYTNLQPKLDKFLQSNCTSSHPHIIYVPFNSDIFKINNTNPNQNNTNIIENQKSTNNTDDLVTVKDYNFTATNENFTQFGKLIDDDENSIENETCCLKHYTVSTVPTNLARNKTYNTIISWYSAITFVLLPLVLIATFNCFLVHAVYKSLRRRRKMTNSQYLLQDNVSMSNENRITVMLIGVVMLFLVCQTPTAFFLIYSNFYEPKDSFTSNIHHALGNIFNFLVMVNASCNFITYCVLSKKYRTTFKSLFCERSRKNKRQDTLAMSVTTRSGNSQRFNSYKNGIRRNISEYHTPRDLETQSLTSIPRSKSLMMRSPGKAKSTDINI